MCILNKNVLNKNVLSIKIRYMYGEDNVAELILYRKTYGSIKFRQGQRAI